MAQPQRVHPPHPELPPDKRPWLDPAEAGAVAGVHPQTIRAWARRCPVLAVRVGGRWRVDARVLGRIIGGAGVMR